MELLSPSTAILTSITQPRDRPGHRKCGAWLRFPKAERRYLICSWPACAALEPYSCGPGVTLAPWSPLREIGLPPDSREKACQTRHAFFSVIPLNWITSTSLSAHHPLRNEWQITSQNRDSVPYPAERASCLPVCALPQSDWQSASW